MSDTALRLAHFHHHRPHKGARKHRVGEATPEPTRRPARWGRNRDAAGLKHANPVARAMGQVSLCSWLDLALPNPPGMCNVHIGRAMILPQAWSRSVTAK